MRILITVIHHYVDRRGGSSRLVQDEVRYLQAQGHEVWSLAGALGTETAGPEPEYECRDGLHLLRYHCPVLPALDPRRISVHQRAVADILRRKAPDQFDVIHGHVPLEHLAACKYFGTGPRRCFSVHSPVVDEVRAHLKHGSVGARLRQIAGAPLVRRIERQCLECSDWVNGFSEFTVSLMKQHHGALAGRIEVIPGWTDFNRFTVLRDRHEPRARLGWPTGVPVLFTLRRLVPRMGLDRLLHAAKALSDRGLEFQLVIGGTGMWRERLEKLAGALHLTGKVRFVGFVPDSELPLMYAACDAFVLPTAELECFGIIAVEALASGTPVLATPVGAIPEILNHLEPRWLAKDATAGSIADLLEAFLKHRLPKRDPLTLRRAAEERWDAGCLVPQFCSRVLGQSSALRSEGAHSG